MSEHNPLLQDFSTKFQTPPFDKIKLSHYLPAVKEGIKQAKAEIDAIKANTEKASFQNTIVALERSGARLNRMSEIFFNLNSAETSDEMQQLAQEISPLLTALANDILLDEKLFERIKEAQSNTDVNALSAEEKTLLDKKVKGFERNGANLPDDKKASLRAIDEELSKLNLTFGQHVLAETNAYEMLLTEKDEIAGLPDSVLEAAKEAAESKEKEGYLFTLQYPSYVPFMTYSSNRTLREKMYRVFSSRAFKGGETDNSDIVKRIANLRFERAKLLGYDSHAHFVLENRMAEKPDSVLSFLDELAEHAKPAAKREMDALKAFAKELDGIDELQRWDITYYSEKLKKAKYEVDDELTKPYFRLEKVVDGVFEVANKLYGIQFKKDDSIPVYHKDVQPYEVLDSDGSHLAVFFADFFPRAGKRDGAWMTSYRSQHLNEKGEQVRPHISIVCNFTKPTSKTPSLLTFREVTTLFHEFGHALHGMLANSTFESLSGTSVYWDFVELPSQVMENWAFEKECLDLFAHHYETNEPIPAELVEKLRKSANFMEGVATLRQLSFGFLDMAWHNSNPSQVSDLVDFERKAMHKVDYLPAVDGSCMSTSFSHIFQGGYSSGYYSYKWAEVLDADTFAYFQEKGIFNQDVATAFRKHVLSAGGSEHPMILYKRFRGAEPSINALLKRAGLLEEQATVN
jgi:peptidyl-dipeptidase Dcp